MKGRGAALGPATLRRDYLARLRRAQARRLGEIMAEARNG